MFSNDNTIQVGDRVTDARGVTYYVKGKNDYQDFDNVDHAKYAMERIVTGKHLISFD